MKTPMTITVKILLEHGLITQERGKDLIRREKQAIIDAYKYGMTQYDWEFAKEPEQYYNDTYGNE